MKIAIIGTGISGLVAARELARDHDITVFEARERLGGHTHTLDIPLAGQTYSVDTGVIVFNPEAYPLFCGLLDELNIPTRPTTMSFSARCARTGFEWGGVKPADLLLSCPQNLLDRRFWTLLREAPRFFRRAPRLLDEAANDVSLRDYLDAENYSQAFRRYFILPLAAAIWSTPSARILDFPARSLVRFFHNHGMLRILKRPVWRTLIGGSRSYLAPLTRGFRDRIRSACPVRSIARSPLGVHVRTGDDEALFDAAVLAVHSDQALALLDDPSPEESAVLGALPYQENEVVVHTDERLLPRSRRAWSSWNYHIPDDPHRPAAVTYNMNLLQGLEAPETFCVSLNAGDAIDPARIIRRLSYRHPVFDQGAIAAQERHHEISGARNTYYCGAYWRYGFHEDGVWSGLRAARQLAAVAAL